MKNKKLITTITGVSVLCIVLGALTFNSINIIKNFFNNKNEETEQLDNLQDIKDNENNNQNTNDDTDEVEDENSDNGNNTGNTNNVTPNVPNNTQYTNNYTNNDYFKGYITPKISFIKNGDNITNILNSTKLGVTGDYVTNSVKYIIDTQNGVTPNVYLNNWNTYALGSDITLSGLQGKQYIWAQVLGKDGKIYTSCSNYFEMLIEYTAPQVTFTKNGDSVENILNSTKLNITGNYVTNSVKYIIDTQNVVVPSLNSSTWNTYTSNSNVTLSGLQGKQYVWVQVLGRDGQIYTSCSSYFEMLITYTAPEVTFTKNGDSVENIANSTKVDVTGNYIASSVKYIIDTQNVVVPNLDLGTWNTYTSNADITLSGLQGKQYVWVQVLGRDGQIYTSCSNYFEMLIAYTAPEVSFTKNGDSVESILNSTKITLTGNYVTNSVKYLIATQNTVAPELDLISWSTYTLNTDVILTGLQGKQYIWVQVLGRDGQIYTNCSSYFEMVNINNLITGFKQPDAENEYGEFDLDIMDFVFSGATISFDIEIKAPNLKSVEYAFSMDGNKPENYTVITGYNKDLSTQTISYSHFFNKNEISSEKTGKLWFRVTDINDQVTEMNVQQYVFTTIDM